MGSQNKRTRILLGYLIIYFLLMPLITGISSLLNFGVTVEIPNLGFDFILGLFFLWFAYYGFWWAKWYAVIWMAVIGVANIFYAMTMDTSYIFRFIFLVTSVHCLVFIWLLLFSRSVKSFLKDQRSIWETSALSKGSAQGEAYPAFEKKVMLFLMALILSSELCSTILMAFIYNYTVVFAGGVRFIIISYLFYFLYRGFGWAKWLLCVWLLLMACWWSYVAYEIHSVTDEGFVLWEVSFVYLVFACLLRAPLKIKLRRLIRVKFSVQCHLFVLLYAISS
jgi:hypothetical protein